MNTGNQTMPAQKKQRTATNKQLTALKLINEGVNPHKAMKQAGYSDKAAQHPKRYLFQAQAIQSIVERFHLELKEEKITTSYLAKKYAEWLDATKLHPELVDRDDKGKPIYEYIEGPDYRTQLEAGKMLKDIFNLTPTKEDSKNLAKRITLEEFIQTS